MDKRRIWRHLLLTAVFASACSTGARPRTPLVVAPAPTSVTVPPAGSVVDTTTVDRKLMFGYQGWFGCPGDGSLLNTWEHWFRRGTARVSTLRVDMWPDVSDLPEDERCNTPLSLPGGQSAQLYSAYNPRTVDRHFA